MLPIYYLLSFPIFFLQMSWASSWWTWRNLSKQHTWKTGTNRQFWSATAWATCVCCTSWTSRVRHGRINMWSPSSAWRDHGAALLRHWDSWHQVSRPLSRRIFQNIKACLYFLLFLNNEKMYVDKNVPATWQGTVYHTYLISWLLMSWAWRY